MGFNAGYQFSAMATIALFGFEAKRTLSPLSRVVGAVLICAITIEEMHRSVNPLRANLLRPKALQWVIMTPLDHNWSLRVSHWSRARPQSHQCFRSLILYGN